MLEEMHLRSMFMWSYVNVYNADFQPADAYHRTHRLVANAIFSPSPRLDLGVEYIYGTRENRDGLSGHASQVQFVALIRF